MFSLGSIGTNLSGFYLAHWVWFLSPFGWGGGGGDINFFLQKSLEIGHYLVRLPGE